ncbi:MAG: hypothetical protein G01um101448_993 [Parcubacteria group bacterium Gr01-1014_48]|nr:MAG: hypothetical protein Greene041614_329 [Parcubacteria group bacterium Greene0416_14]TSC72346.1 MAG: hypothetical protein G01um101448_993 [Parcubacteria group bacterium Gr01-1014_48]TSC99993.1 MAG: hypothetical protein Greene101415_997 [Parcubacteria group bacterium Greene1014_15]TSD07212.1 MAG: hypothetical protein Greene07144_972 [Parcubacteria group bacterium Greene0714_4]
MAYVWFTLKKDSYHRAFSGWKENLQRMFPDVAVIFVSRGEGPILIDSDLKDFPLLYESLSKICHIEIAKPGTVSV